MNVDSTFGRGRLEAFERFCEAATPEEYDAHNGGFLLRAIWDDDIHLEATLVEGRPAYRVSWPA